MLGKLPLDKIHPNPWNPNKVDPINQEKLEKSLIAHGQAMPIVVREEGGGYEVVDGEHRCAAARSLGWPDIDTINLGEVTREEAMRKTVIINQRYGQDDNAKLFDLLATEGVFEDTNQILETLPIDETELSSLFSSDDIDFESLDDDLDPNSDEDLSLSDDSLSAKPPHRILRFKLSNEDADRIEGQIEDARLSQGFTESDSMTNAGDALNYLLKGE